MEVGAFDAAHESEWRPVPEVVRLTLKALHDVIKQQQTAIQNLERKVNQQIDKNQVVHLVHEKTQHFATKKYTESQLDALNLAIEQKPDNKHVDLAVQRKVEPKISLKADVQEVQRCLDEKANVDEVQQLFDELEARRTAVEPRMVAIAEEKAREEAKDVTSKLEVRLRDMVEGKVSELRRDLSDVVARLPTKAGLAAELKKKASRAEVEELLLEQAESVSASIGAKADSASMAAALAAKAPAAGLVEARTAIDKLRVELTRVEGSRAEVEHENSELERKLSELQAETSRSIDSLRSAASRTERELREYDHAVRAAFLRASTHRSPTGLSPARASARVEGTLGLVSVGELYDAADAFRRAIASDAEVGITNLRSEFSELRSELVSTFQTEISTRANELRGEVAALESAVGAKCERNEVEAALARKAEADDMRGWLQWRATVDEEIARRTTATQEALSSKADKADARALAELEMALERRIEAIRDQVEAKPGRDQVEDLVRPLIERATGTSQMIQQKADIDEVNRSLVEVNRELSLRPTLAELNRVVGEQSLILESLCSEHLLGRWIWKSGRTRGERHVVPWNVQNINTNPENFEWDRDRTSITCAAPGLYEVTFGFYARRKPTVQLLVNGEAVLSAVNSATYAVHHSSGRLAAVGPHPAGNVTGLTLIDYIALPPKARVAVSYQGEEGEGFLGLRKM